MAVLPFCPGLTVKIFVNGAPLPEYDDDSDTPASPTTITKYVEATSGARFVIKVSLTEGFPFSEGDMEAKISLDGRITAHHFISKDIFLVITSAKGVVSKSADTPKYRSIASPNQRSSISASTQVPENTLKGQIRTHRAGYGGSVFLEDNADSYSVSEPVAHTKTTWVDYDDITESPFATFDFKYRSINALRALGLIPREPTPLRLEERPEEELSQDELRQLVKQFKEQKVAAVQVKKEAVDKRKRIDEAIESSDDEEVAVIRSRDRKRHRGADEEVIALD
ncbi:hypothetical protein BKA58DRAFT_399585 [Alternaria rosae]|uniref:uncharacterized protein n=1 Tax=Alternaria rosae TaxID=1187941 RepID=UPI001E8CD2B4|nr:uncharacterized protein BKA58DRAFT_399585 [Alternaria rosae]KAH6875377.1 hypothetical protein BKA58DRAFT_399585 [Alternaria rosae]